VSEKREFRYCGPEQQPQRVEAHTSPLSAENARSVIQNAWSNGRVHLGTHFKKRCGERDIDMLDVENLVRNGVVQPRPEYCPVYKNWKYRMAGIIDERHLEVVIALDATEDYDESPLAIVLTAYERTN
jgi:hypothetical protein